MKTKKQLVDELKKEQILPQEELMELLSGWNHEEEEYLYQQARQVRESVYGKDVYLRGLIEFTNYCRNDCYYCGIRRSNAYAQRYRLTKNQILECCEQGYALGFRTFVLQGGEDGYFTDDKICSIVREIKKRYSDCAVTLSIGEKSYDSYKAFFDAGADRYLLRHETANCEHYRMLHPRQLSLENRKQCLWNLKEIGYQVGCGMMVGSPGQKPEYLVEDLLFMHELKPHMIGIGPFIAHKDTPFAGQKSGTLDDTLHLLGILRLMFPHALIPATTALGTIHPSGREMGILAGANVVMPNLSPVEVRGKYLLYDGKICTGDEAAECRLCMQRRIEKTGYHVKAARGDYKQR